MSASRDKIIRKQQIEAGTDKRTLAAAEEAKKRRKTNIQYTVVAVILVVVFAFIFFYNSVLPSRLFTAVTIDGEKYTPAQLNYYYSTSYLNFYNNYYAYISYGLFFDASSPLSDQMYSEDMTWREYFLQSAVDTMTQVQVLNREAEAAGYTLPAEDQEAYEAALENVETSWEDLGYTNLKQYLNMNYGKGVDLDLVREELYRTYVATSYSRYVNDSYTYTAEELAAWYTEHEDEYDVVSYAYVTDYTGELDAEALAAEVNGAGLDEEGFTDALLEAYPDLYVSSAENEGSSLPEAWSEWLLDSARAAGDAAAFTDEDEGSATVVLFLGRDKNDYHPVSFRHILFLAEDLDGDGVYSDDEMAVSAARAQEVYDEWLAGEATEDSFAELANTYSEDTGSNTTGGLYEDVTRGQMVEPIDTWIFDESRQAGDTEVLSYNGSNYAGTHIVFFVGAGDQTYAETLADDTLRTEAFNTWLQELQDAAVVKTSHLKMCGKNH